MVDKREGVCSNPGTVARGTVWPDMDESTSVLLITALSQ